MLSAAMCLAIVDGGRSRPGGGLADDVERSLGVDVPMMALRAVTGRGV